MTYISLSLNNLTGYGRVGSATECCNYYNGLTSVTKLVASLTVILLDYCHHVDNLVYNIVGIGKSMAYILLIAVRVLL